MANRLYLQVRGSKTIFDFPIMADIQFETTSQLQSWGQLVPSIDSATDIINTISAATGEVRGNMLGAKNMFDLPRWSQTDPIKFSTELSLYTKTDAKKDVFDKLKYLTSLCILSQNSDGTYTVPGVSSRNVADMLVMGSTSPVKSLYRESQKADSKPGAVAKETYEYKSKIFALEIPGVIYLNFAYMTSCNPTVSKQKTEKGYPLWAKLMVTFSSLFPASDKVFADAEVAVNLASTPAKPQTYQAPGGGTFTA
jgi:hypothetical protein